MPKRIPKSGSRHNYFIAALFANVLWGFVAIVFRKIEDWPSDTIVYFRIFTSLLFVSVFILLIRFSTFKRDWLWVQTLPGKQRSRMGVLTILSSILIIGNWFSFIYAVNRISIKSAAFAYLVCPLITALAGRVLLKEKLSPIKWISLGIALGSVLMLSRGSFTETIWSIVIASFYAFYLIIQRGFQEVDKLNFLTVQLIVCSLLVIPLMIYTESPIPSSSTFWINISIIAGIFTVIPLFLSMFALSKIASTTMGILLYVNPVVAFAVAVFYFGEQLSVDQLFAYSLLVVAIALYNSEIIKQIFSSFVKRLTH